MSVLQPSVLVNQIFSATLFDPSLAGDVVNRLCDLGYYRKIETGSVPHKPSMQVIRDRHEKDGVRFMQWVTQNLADEGLNISALDSALRDKSVARVIDLVKLAHESGAQDIGILGGIDPGPDKRSEATKLLQDSLSRIGQTAQQLNMRILLEPLDRFAHKKQLIGPSGEALSLIKALQPLPVYIAWDSAHVALNEEDLHESIQLGDRFTAQGHLANAVLDKNDPLYGDHHMMFGAPGFLTDDTAAAIVKTFTQLTPPDDVPLTIAVEVNMPTIDEGWLVEQDARKFLQKALASV